MSGEWSTLEVVSVVPLPGRDRWRLLACLDRITACAVMPGSDVVVLGVHDGRLWWVSAATGADDGASVSAECIASVGSPISALCPLDRERVFVHTADGRVLLVKLNDPTAVSVHLVADLSDESRQIGSLVVADDRTGRHLVAGLRSGRVVVIDVETGTTTQLRSYSMPVDDICSLGPGRVMVFVAGRGIEVVDLDVAVAGEGLRMRLDRAFAAVSLGERGVLVATDRQLLLVSVDVGTGAISVLDTVAVDGAVIALARIDGEAVVAVTSRDEVLLVETTPNVHFSPLARMFPGGAPTLGTSTCGTNLLLLKQPRHVWSLNVDRARQLMCTTAPTRPMSVVAPEVLHEVMAAIESIDEPTSEEVLLSKLFPGKSRRLDAIGVTAIGSARWVATLNGLVFVVDRNGGEYVARKLEWRTSVDGSSSPMVHAVDDRRVVMGVGDGRVVLGDLDRGVVVGESLVLPDHADPVEMEAVAGEPSLVRVTTALDEVLVRVRIPGSC